MCGIVGVWTRRGRPVDARTIGASASLLAHRGPDTGGVWVDEQAGVAIGHRRLSIIDLSTGGAQPMLSSDERFVLTYNGEIYNHADLREELQRTGTVFRSASDTEVLVEACAQWGVAAATRRLVGMFAFGLWDRRDRVLHLVRDRLGIKPLYWTRQDGRLVFASELKALIPLLEGRPELDRRAAGAFLQRLYVPAPLSIYAHIGKLSPGTRLAFPVEGEPRLDRYWDFAEQARKGARERLDLADDEAETHVDGLVRRVVADRMIADVPLGALLSGGLDSSTVVACMQAQSSRPVKTFTIGYADPAFDESVHARRIAAHLGTDHTDLVVESGDALAVIPGLPEMYDEPFADASQIPTFLISRLARQHVTVALSGDGGDEVFCGYSRYRRLADEWATAERVPAALRPIAGILARRLPARLLHLLNDMLPAGRRLRNPAEAARTLAGLLALRDVDGFYSARTSLWPEAPLAGGISDAVLPWPDAPGSTGRCTAWERFQHLDTRSYLPDDILTKVDRASMAVALEVRVPLIDHRLVEFMWRLPQRFRLRDGQMKWLLRRVLERYVPRPLFDRPKTGFHVPLGDWLRGPLRDWAEDLLDPRRMAEVGLFDTGRVRHEWARHIAGARRTEAPLWGVLMLESWRRHWLS